MSTVIRVADKIVSVVRMHEPNGITRLEVRDVLRIPDGTVRRTVQDLMRQGRLIEQGKASSKGAPAILRLAHNERAHVQEAKALYQSAFEKRFWACVDKGPNLELIRCWLWTGEMHADGKQGVFAVAGQGVRARRLAVVLHTGAEITGTVRVCEHTAMCVNPSHTYRKVRR